MAYPLDAGGVDDYPVKVGSALVTMVDPNRGFEKAYNRWYERDHFYAGCMIGPYLFAGSRWIAPRELKNLRWPTSEGVAEPYDAGSYVSIYWVERDHHQDDFDNWASPQVHWLYSNDRGFPERTHVHTVVVRSHRGQLPRRRPGPGRAGPGLRLPRDRGGVVRRPRPPAAADLHAELSKSLIPDLLSGSSIEIASSWTPSRPSEERSSGSPMPLGTPAGGPNRLLQILFVGGDVREAVNDLRAYTDGIEKAGLADTQLVAPFFRTTPGRDTYLDQLW